MSLTLPRASKPPPGIPYRDSPVTSLAAPLVIGTCALSDAVLSPVLRVTRPLSVRDPGVESLGHRVRVRHLTTFCPTSLWSGCASLYAGCTRVSPCTSSTLYEGKLWDSCRPPSLLCLACTVTPCDLTPDSCLCESASVGSMPLEPRGGRHVQCCGCARCPSPLSHREVLGRRPRPCRHTRPGFALCTSLHCCGSSEGDGNLADLGRPWLTLCVLL